MVWYDSHLSGVLDHTKVYYTDGQNVAGCYLRVDCKVKQQRNR